MRALSGNSSDLDLQGRIARFDCGSGEPTPRLFQIMTFLNAYYSCTFINVYLVFFLNERGSRSLFPPFFCFILVTSIPEIHSVVLSRKANV